MRSMMPSSGGAPLAFNTETMPHTSAFPGCDHGESALFFVQPIDTKIGFRAPRSHLSLGLRIGVMGPVPIEVDVQIRLKQIALGMSSTSIVPLHAERA